MGLGDQLLAAGKAKLLYRETGRPVSIGDGTNVLWCSWYDHNPYLSRKPNGNWVIDYPGHRGYYLSDTEERWLWNYAYRAEPAEIFFTEAEQAFTDQLDDFILIEPNLKGGASPAKRWRGWQELVNLVHAPFVQPAGGIRLSGVDTVKTSLRQIACWMKAARAYVGPDGALHHLAAALGTPAVVIFGAFAPPEVTGYPCQTIFSAGMPWGDRQDTERSRAAMDSIKPLSVAEALVSKVNDSSFCRIRSA